MTLTTDSSLDTVSAFRTMGWGANSPGGPSPVRLQEVDVPLVADDAPACSGGDAEICAGNLVDGGVDSCQGDSGGPLLAQTPGGWVEVGIVSWGSSCAQPGEPGHYAQVSTYLPAIRAAIARLEAPASGTEGVGGGG